MPNQYLELFNRFTRENKGLKISLKDTVSQYSADLLQVSKKSRSKKVKSNIDKIRRELSTFNKHLDSGKAGTLIIDYKFKSQLSDEFQAVLKMAILRERMLINSVSPLVSDCEIIIAANEHSPKVIYEQLARLEKALQSQAIESYHVVQVKFKISELYNKLYEKFAQLILDANSVESFEKDIDYCFAQAFALDLPKSETAYFRNEIDAQIEYLTKKEFFKHFYALPRLAEKHEFTFDFYQQLKQLNATTPELRATLVNLFYLIINRAYKPCDMKKFNMMRDQGATIESVFTALRDWACENWKQYEKSDLIEHLIDKLQNEEQAYQDWQEVSRREGDHGHDKPMYQLHTMRFAGDPNQDPKQVLLMLPSPKKPKAKKVVVPVNSLPTSSLLSNEVLDFSDDELDTQTNRPYSSKK